MKNGSLILSAGLLVLSLSNPVQAQNFNQQVIVNNLNSPRGITLDSRGIWRK
jgi:hypothetical protein